MDPLTIASLVASCAGAVLAIVAIGVSLGFFMAGHRLSLSTLEALNEVKTSTHVTEVTSTQYTSTMIDELFKMLRGRVVDKVTSEESLVDHRIEDILSKYTTTLSLDVRKTLQKEIRRELTGAFQSIKYRAATTPLETPPLGKVPSMPTTSLPLGVPRVVLWMEENKEKYKFYGVKFLRDRVFRSDPAAQEGLQFCIDIGIFSLYKVENPNNPERKTLACRLNREHPSTEALLHMIREQRTGVS
jgi:hypothetical protein